MSITINRLLSHILISHHDLKILILLRDFVPFKYNGIDQRQQVTAGSQQEAGVVRKPKHNLDHTLKVPILSAFTFMCWRKKKHLW